MHMPSTIPALDENGKLIERKEKFMRIQLKKPTGLLPLLPRGEERARERRAVLRTSGVPALDRDGGSARLPNGIRANVAHRRQRSRLSRHYRLGADHGAQGHERHGGAI